MNKRKIILTFLVLLCFTLLTSCDGGVGVSGRVLDEHGKPIKGAKVVLISRGYRDEWITRDDGSYDVGMIHEPRTPYGSLTVSKEGYDTYQLQYTSREELGNKRDVVLKSFSASEVVSK